MLERGLIVKFWGVKYYITDEDRIGVDFEGNYYLLARHNKNSKKTDIGIPLPKTRIKDWLSKEILWEKELGAWKPYCKKVYKVNIIRLEKYYGNGLSPSRGL